MQTHKPQESKQIAEFRDTFIKRFGEEAYRKLHADIWHFFIQALQTAERRGEERERVRTEKLWDLLDSIDTLPDMLHPKDVGGHEKCWKMMVERAEKRHEVLQSDGYSLKPTSEDNK